MTLALRQSARQQSSASTKGGIAGGAAMPVTASCIAEQDSGMRIPSYSDDLRRAGSGIDLDDEVVSFRCVRPARLAPADTLLLSPGVRDLFRTLCRLCYAARSLTKRSAARERSHISVLRMLWVAWRQAKSPLLPRQLLVPESPS